MARSCNITRQQFREEAKPLDIKVGETALLGAPKEFSTGSLGWNVNGKMTLKVGDRLVDVQIGINLTIIGSKELPTS